MGPFLLRRWVRQVFAAGRPGKAVRRGTVTRPRVEQLEDRTQPSTLAPITVFNPMLPPSDSTGGTSLALTSADGRFTVFNSTAANVVPGQVETAVASNVFLYDRQTKTTSLVSHVAGSPATGGDGDSVTARISSDGRFVEYSSAASNLVAGQAGPRGQFNVFLYDRTTGTNTLVNHRFDSATTAGNGSCETIFTTGFSFGDNSGTYLLFNSYSTDLVPGQAGPAVLNLYLYDTATGTNTLVSHVPGDPAMGANGDSQDADMTSDGSAIVYKSFASNLVPFQSGITGNIFLYYPGSDTTLLVSGTYDSSTGSNSSTNGAGFSQLPVISADGSTVAYVSGAYNAQGTDDLVAGQSTSGTVTKNVYVYDVFSGRTTLASGANGSPSQMSNGDAAEVVVNRDGGTLAFISAATNLTPNQGGSTANVFLYANSGSGGTLTLVSHLPSSATAAGGVAPNDTRTFADLSITGDGHYLAYPSSATSLEAGVPNPSGSRNVYLYVNNPQDSNFGDNLLISFVKGNPAQVGDSNSSYADLSTDGTAIAFLSTSTDLDPGVKIADGGQNLFEYDLTTGTGPDLASRSAFRATATSLVYGTSADGRYVVFTSNATDVLANNSQVDTNADQDVFLLDRTTGAYTLVSHVPSSPTTAGDSGAPSTRGGTGGVARAAPAISADGNWVVFVSAATDLASGETGEAAREDNQVYVFNRLTGVVSLVSHDVNATASNVPVGNDISDSPVISADGRYVAYTSNATNLVQGLVEPDPGVREPNVYLYDTASGVNTLVSHAASSLTTGSDLRSFSPAISDGDGAGGPLIAYVSDATNLVDNAALHTTENVYLYDQATGATVLVSHQPGDPLSSGAGNSVHAALSADAGTVAFVSFANDLVAPGQPPGPYTNVFLYDVASGAVRLASGAGGSATQGGGGYSDSPALNDDGSRVAFRSDAPNLVAKQVNTPGTTSNVFLFDARAGTLTLVSHAAGLAATTAAGNSAAPGIDGLGGLVVYLSTATNLVPGQQGGGVNNVFVYAVPLGVNALASGQGGSPTLAGASPTYLAVISRDPLVVYNLLSSPGGGTSVGFANSLISLSLSPNTVALGSPPGTVVGTLSVDTVFKGQFRPPTYSLPAGEGDNAAFSVGGQGALLLATTAGGSGYVIRAHVDIGVPDLGDAAALLNVYTTPAGGPAGPDPVVAMLVPVRAGKHKTLLMVEVFDLVTGAEVAAVVSPYQAPAYRAITLTPLGPGLFLLSARKGKHTVSILLAV